MAKTKLDAINTCLKGIGVTPVETEDDPDLDAALASQTIETVSNDIQSRGWWFNKEYNWNLIPNPETGFISVPGSAISIVTTGDSRLIGLTIRGTKIYDLHNHTFDLRNRANKDGSIEFVFITELEYEDLPPVAKQAITYTARRIFAQDLEVDKARWEFQSRDEQMAMAMLLREDARNNKRNYLRDNAPIATFLSQVGGSNAYSYSVGVFPKRSTT